VKLNFTQLESVTTIPCDSNVSADQAGKVTDLARRRYQKGALQIEGKEGKQKWVLRYRDDVITPDGRKRPEVRVMLGSLQDLPTERLARRAAEKSLARVNAIDFQPGIVATMMEFAEVFEADAVPLMRRSAQASTRSIITKHITPKLGGHRLHEITGRSPQQLITKLHADGLSKKTIKNIIGVLSLMLTRAREWGYMAGTVDRRTLKYPAGGIKRPEPHFTPYQSVQIVNGAEDAKWALMFETMARTGIRLGEALGLAWPAIDFDALVIHVVQSCVLGELEPVKSKKSNRDLPLPSDLARKLLGYKAEWQPNEHGLLWARSDGEPLRGDVARADFLKPALEKVGITEGAFHAFRHGHATNLFSAGANPKAVQDLMGHADIKTTMEYTHSVTVDQRKAVDAVSSMFENFAGKCGGDSHRSIN